MVAGWGEDWGIRMGAGRARSRKAIAVLTAAFAPALLACPSTPYPEAKVDLASAPAAQAPPAPAAEVLRFSVAAMLSPQETFSGYSRLLARLGTALGVRVELVQRRTYAEVNDLLAAGKIDAAILCTGGYLELERRSPGATEVLAVPVIDGESTYRSYLVVPAASPARSLEDLAGKRFAYTDDLSLSGHLYAAYLLGRIGRDPRTFFGAVQYTGSHDRSIEAVARGAVDGAAVDSLVLDAIVSSRPAVARAVRVIHRSPPFGAAPVVASTRLPPARREQLRAALLALEEDGEGAAALRVVGFDGFRLPPPALYDDAATVVWGGR
jgi:phosphonate transport system substrate-binding protein